MKKLYVLRGVPGSGKSTFIRQHRLEPYTIATDNLRLLYGNLKSIYDEERHQIRQVIPQEYNEQTFTLLDQLIRNKMARGETVIVDATHLYPNAFEPYLQYKKEFDYEVYVVDFTKGIGLNELLRRNETRVDYRWINPEIIKNIYQFARTHPRLPRWVKQITPDKFDRTLYLEETDLSSYRSIAIIGHNANFRGALKPHEFYFTFNHDFALKPSQSHHVAYINQDLSTINESNAFTVFPFKFRGQHYLVSSHNLRADLMGPSKKLYGKEYYKFGLINPQDLMQEFPEPHYGKRQINLETCPQHQINRLA